MMMFKTWGYIVSGMLLAYQRHSLILFLDHGSSFDFHVRFQTWPLHENPSSAYVLESG